MQKGYVRGFTCKFVEKNKNVEASDLFAKLVQNWENEKFWIYLQNARKRKSKIVRNLDLFAKVMQNMEIKELEDLFTKLYKEYRK